MTHLKYQTSVIHPLECIKEGWEAIKPNYWLIFAITLVGLLIASIVPFAILLGPMNCGIYYCVLRQLRCEEIKFGHLFRGFDYFGPAIVATLVIILPIIVFSIINWITMFGYIIAASEAINRGNTEAIIGLYAIVFGEALVFAIVIAVLHTLLIFAYPLIVDFQLSGIEAFKTSARAVWANLSGVAGLILWQILLGFAGMLVCGVGIYFVLPVMYAGVAVAYCKVFPRQSHGNLGAPPPESYNWNT